MTTDHSVTPKDADPGLSIITVALPQAQHDLGISTADRQWVVTA